MDKDCFLCNILYIKFAVESKLKNIIESKKLAAVDPKINIQPVNAKHFFCII